MAKKARPAGRLVALNVTELGFKDIFSAAGYAAEEITLNAAIKGVVERDAPSS